MVFPVFDVLISWENKPVPLSNQVMKFGMEKFDVFRGQFVGTT
jgi:hypothetical protein